MNIDFKDKAILRCSGKDIFIIDVEKPRDFDPFGQTGFAHLWLQYD